MSDSDPGPDVPLDDEADALEHKLFAAVRRAAADLSPNGSADDVEGAPTVPLDDSSEGVPVLRPGVRLGGFLLKRFVARGGMGQVWEAEDEALRRTVALKLVLPERVNTRSLELFAREARAGGRLAHPNLVATYAHGTDASLAWIAQEFVEGTCTLKDVIDRLRAAPSLPAGHDRSAAALVAQIADGLQAAHAAGVIHRDVKPQNVLIAPDDTPKVTDFGLARISDDSVHSRTGDFAGTYAYMSPEQVTAKRMGLDHRTDIFSLGVVLYELLTLRRPFEGDTTHQIAQQIIAHDPPDPTRVRSRCPRELAVIVGMALEKSPDRRYASMADFAADLRRHLAHEPIAARPPGPLVRAGKWTRRHPARAAALAVAVTALAVVSLLLARNVQVNQRLNSANEELARVNTELATQSERVLAGEAEARRQLYLASIQGARAALEGGDLAEARRLLERAPESLRQWEWGHLHLAADPSVLVVGEPGHQVDDGAWSPDGKRLALAINPRPEARSIAPSASDLPKDPMERKAFLEALRPPPRPGFVRVVEVPGGRVVAELSGHGHDVSRVAWSRDGRRVVGVDSADEALLWDVASQRVLQGLSTAEADGVLNWTQGEGLSHSASDSTRPVWPDTSRPLPSWLEEQGLDADVASLSPDGRLLVELDLRGAVILHDGSTGEPLGQWQAHDARPRGTRWSPDSRLLLSFNVVARVFAGAQTDATVSWHRDPASRGLGDHGAPCALAWSPDGESLALGSRHGVALILDAATGRPTNVLQGEGDALEELAFDPTGQRLAAVSWQGGRQLMIWDTVSGERVWTLDRRQLGGADLWLPGRGLAWSPDGLRLVVAGSGRTLHALTVSDEHPVWSVGFPGRSDILQVAWSPDGARLAVALSEGAPRILDARDGAVLHVLEGHSDPWFGGSVVGWSPSGRQLATGGTRGPGNEVLVWDAETGLLEQTLTSLDRAGVNALAWSPDGGRLAVGSLVAATRLWDVESGEMLLRVSDDRGLGSLAVAWSPDGRRLAMTTIASGLCVAESRAADALPGWSGREARRRLRPLVDDVFARLGSVAKATQALLAAPELDEHERDVAGSMLLLRRDAP